MNITIGSRSSTWKNLNTRHVVGACAVALALSIAITGGWSVQRGGSADVGIQPQASTPSTLYGTLADAAFAAEGPVDVTPLYGTMADAAVATLDLGFPAFELTAPSFGTMADAAFAAQESAPASDLSGLLGAEATVPAFYPEIQEQSHPEVAAYVTTEIVPGGFYQEVQEQSHPEVNPYVAVDSYTGGFYPEIQEQSHPQIAAPQGEPLFPSMVDAELASY